MTRGHFTSGLTSRLVLTGLLCWALAGTAYAVLRLTFGERPVGIHVRWAPTIDDVARHQLEQRYQLARAELREDRTFRYALTDRSRDNIRNLVLDPAVEDTHWIDRTAFRVGDAAPWLPYMTPSPGIPMGLEFLSVLGFLGGFASISLWFLEREDVPPSQPCVILDHGTETAVNKGNFTSGLTSRLVLTGLLCWALAGTAYTVLRLTFGERPVGIHVRWAPTIDDVARLQLEQRYQLARAELREDRTFRYALTDRSRDNIRNLVLDPAVEDTHEIDRTAFRVGDAAPWLPYVTPSPGIPMGLEFLSVLGFLSGLASISLGFLERTDYRVFSPVVATVNRRLRLRGVIQDLMFAAVALFGIALIATGSITFGSVLGNYAYPVEESNLSVRSLLILALILPAALAGVHYGNRWIDSRQELVLALWFILGTGAVFTIRWLSPFSLGAVVQSDRANSFYSPTLTYSALQFLSQFEQIVPSLPFHAATNLPGKVLLFHLLQTVTDSPQVMGALIVVIANLAALILFYIVKQLSQNGSVALMSFVLCLFLPARLGFLPLLNTVSPVLILAAFWLLLKALESQSRAIYGLLGGSLYVVLLFEPLPLVMGLLFAAMVLRAVATRALPWTRAVEICVLTAAGFVATHVVFVALFDFDLLQAFRVAFADAVNFNREAGRPYSVWLFANLKETFLAMGIAQALFLALVVLHLARTLCRAVTSRQSSLGTCPLETPVVFTLALVGALAFLDLAGVNRGEVTRLWIFLFCFMTATTAWFIDRWQQPWRFQLILTLTLLQVVVQSEIVWFFDSLG